MKIECVRTYRLSCPLPEILGSSQGKFDSRQALLVQIITDEGIEGWGECAGPAAVAQAAITTFYGPRLLGMDPLATDLIWHMLWRHSLDWARRGMMMSALSGIDMAAWDLKGKALYTPLSSLLGGRIRDRIPCYATGCYFRDLPETDHIPALVDEAQRYIEAGYRAVKIQIGRNLSFDMALIRAMRESMPRAHLLADANHAYDIPESVAVGKVLEEYRFDWFEDPLSPENAGAYRYLSQTLRIPLGAGKREQTRWGFQSLLESGGVHLAMPDLAYCGGLSEGLRIRALTSSAGINMVPHTGGRTMFGVAAALHFIASDHRQPGRSEGSIGFLECDAPDANPFQDALFETPVEIEGGLARVPNTPGLGVALDAQIMRIFTMEKQEVS